MDRRMCVAVLVIEDEQSLRTLIVERLKGEGFHVCAASSVLAAVPVLQTMPRPTLLLLDLMGPSNDVGPMLGALHSDDRLVILPVVVSNSATARHGRYSGTKQLTSVDDLLRIATSLCLRRN